MTQDEAWLKKYNEVITFIETNKRNPSKNNPEERGLCLNWIKHNRKMMNNGQMKMERMEKFSQLLELIDKYKYVNQYK